MKLQFKDQDFQTEAVNAVSDLFTGQNKDTATFSILEGAQRKAWGEFGVGNAVLIDEAAQLENMHAVQRRNRLPLTNDLQGRQFCIEMETGTGKTFVYTKTIFELNKRYGFTKFIIVVPSVAIREGVHKSLEVTREYFAKEYENVPYRYFIYNSGKPDDVRKFATNADIEIMIINIDAFKKAENIFNQAQDKLNGETAKSYIRDTNPIVIIDEPQSVDGTAKSKEAIADLNPLCVLRYSATHKEKINLLYRLTPVDAYQRGLVKQICVSANTVSGDFNKPYIRLVSVSNDKGFSAKIELDVAGKGGVIDRKTITVKKDDDLYLLSGKRDLYDGYVVAGFDVRAGAEYIEFSSGETLRQGTAIGGVDENIIKEAQIRRTIQAHFDKELVLLGQGIKVLSLFFIDRVSNYREEDGGKGIYARMFEKCYNELLARPEYEPLRTRFTLPVEDFHNGYFSQDGKKAYKDTRGDSKDDEDTYALIMRDKERLLSFESPLRFIFSHSALKEGWDNPNVFQVCTLIEQKSSFTARQKVGRGLRLCVNQQGERIEDKDINVLHVMASESFADFAAALQRDIENETGMKFGVVQLDMFVGLGYEETITRERTITPEQVAEVVEAVQASVPVASLPLPEPLKVEIVKLAERAVSLTSQTLSDVTYLETTTEQKTLTHEDATAVVAELKQRKLLNRDNTMTTTMKEQVLTGTLDLGARFTQAEQRAITLELKSSIALPELRDARREVTVRIRKRAMVSETFMALWDKIKQKTYYRVQIDSEKLVDECVDELKELRSVPRVQIHYQTADLDIQQTGVAHTETSSFSRTLDETYTVLPDILRMISTETHLKRSTVARIIRESGRGNLFLQNPQAFTEKVLDIIARKRRDAALDGIKYEKIGGQEYAVQEVFKMEELANLDRAIGTNRGLYDHVIWDSAIESKFAQDLDKDEDVEMFFKLPKGRFKIDTPLGNYSPDWAVLWNRNGDKKLYFVLETKGSTDDMKLHGEENWKIKCGKAHFAALGTGVDYQPTTDWGEFKKTV